MTNGISSESVAGMLCRISLLVGVTYLGSSCGLIPQSKQEGGLSFQQGVAESSNLSQHQSEDARELEKDLLSKYYTEFSRRLDDEVSALRKADVELEAQIADLRVRLNKFELYVKSEIDRLTKEDESLRKELERLEITFAKRMDGLETDIELVLKMALDNTKSVADLKSELTKAIAESADSVRREVHELRQAAINGIRNELTKGLADAKSDLDQARSDLEAADAANKAALEASDEANKRQFQEAAAAAKEAFDKHLEAYAKLKSDYDKRMSLAEQKILDLGKGLESQAKALEDYKKEAERIYVAKVEYERFIGRSSTLKGALSALRSDLVGSDGRGGVVAERIQKKYDELKTVLIGKDGKGGLVANIASDQARKKIESLRNELFGKDGQSGLIGKIEDDFARAKDRIDKGEDLAFKEIQVQIEHYRRKSLDIKAKVNAAKTSGLKPEEVSHKLLTISLVYQPHVTAYKELILDAIKSMKSTYGSRGDNKILDQIAEIEKDFKNALELEVFTKGEIEAMSDELMQTIEKANEVASWANAVRSHLGHGSMEFVNAFQNLEQKVGDLGERMDSAEDILSGLEAKFQQKKQEAIDAAADMVGMLRNTMDESLVNLSGKIDDVNSKVDSQVEELKRGVSRTVNDLANLRSAHQALHHQHNSLVTRFAKKVANEQKQKDLDEKMRSAQDALILYMQAKQKAAWRVMELLNPNQMAEKKDFYDSLFRLGKPGRLASVYSDDVTNKKCEIQTKAVFANAGNMDAHMLLSHYLVSMGIKGELGRLDQTLNIGLGSSLLEGKAQIQKAAILGTLEVFPAVEDASCRVRVEDWARYVLTSDDLNTKLESKGVSIPSLLNADIGSDSFKTLYARVKKAANSYAKRWQDYQDVLNSIGGDLAMTEVAEIAANLVEKIVNEHRIKDLEHQFSEFRKGVEGVVGNLNSTGNNVSSNTAAIKGLKEEFQNKLMVLDQKNLDLKEYVQSSIDKKMQDMKEKTGQIQNSVLDLVKVVATLAQRQGYGDLVASAQSAGAIIKGSFNINPSSLFVEPKVTNVQHLYGNLTYDVKAGHVTNPDGSRFDHNNVANSWTAENQRKSHYFDETCSSASLGFSMGSQIKGDKCWINFRSSPLANAHNKVVENVVIRLFGSAEFVHVKVPYTQNTIVAGDMKYDAKDRVYMVSPNADSKRHAQRYIAEYLKGGLDALTSNPLGISRHLYPVKAHVQGSSFMGAFDIQDPTLLDRGVAGFNSINGFKIEFTPVRYVTDNRQYLDAAGTQPNQNYGQVVQKGIGARKDYQVYLYSPIVLDFLNEGVIRTTSQLERPVKFDLDGNGVQETVGWVEGLDGSFLTLDLDLNGTIDSGRELFGQATKLQDGSLARNGYEALGQYDANGDGSIDKEDPVFSRLRIWSDINADGISQKSELGSLGEANVTSISLKYTQYGDGKVYQNGNWLKYQAKFFGPEHCGEEGCKSYDVFFGATQALSQK